MKPPNFFVKTKLYQTNKDKGCRQEKSFKVSSKWQFFFMMWAWKAFTTSTQQTAATSKPPPPNNQKEEEVYNGLELIELLKPYDSHTVD